MTAPIQVDDPQPNPIRFHHLRAYGVSAAHGKYERSLPVDARKTNAMDLGTAVHSLVLGGKKIVGYPATRNGKKYDAFCAENEGATILTQAAFDHAKAMADAVLNCPLAQPLLLGIKEKTRLFQFMGETCRVTPDVFGHNGLTELKTCASADPFRFPWDARKRCYHGQMAFQRLSFGEHGKGLECYIIAVESKPPFPVTVYRLSEDLMLLGEKVLTLWMERLKVSEASQQWPAYAQDIVEIDAPEETGLLEFSSDDDEDEGEDDA